MATEPDILSSSDEEALRYNRQIVLRGFDFDGQEALKAGRVLITGLGGLRCAAAQYLAAAGVGHLTLLDFDTVSLQSSASDPAYRCPYRDGKTESAAIALKAVNPALPD